MRLACGDTSFLISFYGSDSNSSRAVNFARQLGQPLTISAFNEYEFAQSLRFAVWRSRISSANAAQALRTFEVDKRSGGIILASCNLQDVMAEANRLSLSYTEKGGHRAFDILHVAAAVHLGATDFLSFDLNQRRLAQAEGLKLNP